MKRARPEIGTGTYKGNAEILKAEKLKAEGEGQTQKLGKQKAESGRPKSLISWTW
jgi:hypothetical protein